MGFPESRGDPENSKRRDGLPYFEMVGRAPAFRAALQIVERLAACNVAALIQGETGTGKELAARAIHYLGARAAYPFVPVNCGAIPDELIGNELFGHVRGAYTDAREGHDGLIADAHGGTLFLDEVDTLSSKAQVALLRFLQDGVYRPLGGKTSVCADVRIITATNADLSALVSAGRFRADLLYRLDVISVTLPPLRERGGDVILLAEHFLKSLAHQYDRTAPSITPGAAAALIAHNWPGNVRELENAMHREFLLSDQSELRVAAWHSVGGRFAPVREPRLAQAKAALVNAFERSFVARALEQAQGNVSVAARRCGKERRAFGKLLKKHGIDRLSYTRD